MQDVKRLIVLALPRDNGSMGVRTFRSFRAQSDACSKYPISKIFKPPMFTANQAAWYFAAERKLPQRAVVTDNKLAFTEIRNEIRQKTRALLPSRHGLTTAALLKKVHPYINFYVIAAGAVMKIFTRLDENGVGVVFVPWPVAELVAGNSPHNLVYQTNRAFFEQVPPAAGFIYQQCFDGEDHSVGIDEIVLPASV